MANRLNMAKIQAIEQLQALKWSQRKIARELGIDRGAVARHLRRLEDDSKAAIPPTGSLVPKAATFPPSPGTFSIREDQAGYAATDSESKAAIPPTGSTNVVEANSAVSAPSNLTSSEGHAQVSPAGRRSQCETYREVIQAKLDQQLSAQRIWQDLVADHGIHRQVRQRQAFRAPAHRSVGRCRFGGWKCRRARKPRSISAPAHGSWLPTASGARRMSFGSS